MNINEDLTFIIKTFERPFCLFRLVKSIFKYFPQAKILIGDDSEKSCKERIEKKYPGKNIIVFELPHDCGISYGRNYLVQKVKTPYFVLLDDDFEFDEMTDIKKGLEILQEHNFDIVGGFFRNYHSISTVFDLPIYFLNILLGKVQKYNYLGYIEYNDITREVYVKYYTKVFPEFERVDIVHNFFIARVVNIRRNNLWDDCLKIHEHTPFFLKAKINGLKVGFTKYMSVKHKPIRPQKYGVYRDRNFTKEWMTLYNIHKFEYEINDEKSGILFN